MSNNIETTNTKIDLRIFLIESIVEAHKHLFKDIDKLYEKYKYKAYKAAKSSPYYNHEILCSGSIEKQIYSRKLLGIVSLGEVNPDVAKELDELFKKGWRDVYSYISKFKNDKLKLSDIYSTFITKDLSIDKINSILLVSIILALNTEIQIDTSDEIYQKFIQILNDRLKFHSGKSSQKFNYNTLNQDLLNHAKQLHQRITEHYGELTYIEFLRDLRNDDDKDLLTFINNYEILFETENLASFNHKITNKDVEEICALYFLTYKNKNVKDAVRYLISALFLKITLKEYNKVKEYYFKNNKETLYLEMEDKEEQIKNLTETNQKLLSQNKYLEAENSKLKRDYEKQYQSEIARLQAEINKLKEENDRLRENEYELFRLREYVFLQEHDDIEYEQIDVDIPQINGLVVGGHENWRRIVGENLPNTWKIVSGNNPNIDLQFMDNVEIVFFNVAGMNHATYYKIRNHCQRRNISYYFISNSSFDVVKNEIYKYWSDTSEH